MPRGPKGEDRATGRAVFFGRSKPTFAALRTKRPTCFRPGDWTVLRLTDRKMR